MSRSNIAFIGGGNMARAIAGGLIRSGFDPSHVLISEPIEEQRSLLAAEFPNSTVTDSNDDVASRAGTMVLAVKPQILKNVCSALKETVQAQKPMVISIGFGLSFGTFIVLFLLPTILVGLENRYASFAAVRSDFAALALFY